jgi:phenylacetic acid degradation operon negative regulatory protein
MRPSWRDVFAPDFEAWAWRQGLGRRLAQLQQRKLLEAHPESPPSQRIVRLTEAGRLVALGGRDPVARWARPWDGRWRLLLFDLPSTADTVRARLRRYLRAEQLGYLQNSVWLTPDSLEESRRLVQGVPAAPEGFLLFEGRPASGESDAAIVHGAWDFAAINAHYAQHLAIVRTAPRQWPRTEAEHDRLQAWARREHAAWKRAAALDPFLPLALLPSDYLGRTAWSARGEAFAALAPGAA